MTTATARFVPQIVITRTADGLSYDFNVPLDPDSEIPYDVAGRPGRQEIDELYRKLKAVPGVDKIFIGIAWLNVDTTGHYWVEGVIHPRIMQIVREHFGWYGYVEGSTEIKH